VTVATCINFLFYFIRSSLSSLLFFFFFFFLSVSLSLCAALLSLPQSQVNGSVEVVVGCQRLGGGGCGLVVVSGSVGDGLMVVSGSVGDGGNGGSRR
jgi:hypothetical protein